MNKLYLVVSKDDKNKEHPLKSILGIFINKQNVKNLWEQYKKSNEHYPNSWFDFCEIEIDFEIDLIKEV